MPARQIVFVTGLSGAGRSTAMHALEDLQFWCVDNLPLQLLEKLLQLATVAGGRVAKLGLVGDARDPELVAGFPELYRALREAGHAVELLFLEATDAELRRRFELTGRPHPLAATHGGLGEAIAAERELLAPLRARATAILDTTALTVHELRRQVVSHLGGASRRLQVDLLSFAQVAGIPAEADLVLDAGPLAEDAGPAERLPAGSFAAPTVLERAEELIAFLLPCFEREGKAYLTVAVGCPDGQRRAPALAERLRERISARGLPVQLRHRDRSAQP